MDIIQDMAENLKLLGDKNRLTILIMLKEKEMCVCDIADLLETSQPNASQHLRKLKAAGLLKESKRGQWVYYSLNIEDKPYIKHVLDYAPSLKDKTEKLNSTCDFMEV
ncbi:MAG: ArsR family transcriptional regulator [Paenibacillus sp.]|jgi:ArsR family transcriptional regulator|nr:ArsR family transcriptional regulator [Paenibacillus sp.]